MNKMCKFTLVVFILIAVSAVSYAQHPQQLPIAKRVIALAPHIVEMLFEVGAGDIIVGTTEHADFPEKAKNIERIGNYARLNIEQVLALDPDLIIAWKTGNPSDDLARLDALGVPIVYSEPLELEDVAKEIQYFATLTGFESEGKLASQKFLKTLSAIRLKYINKTPINSFFELWANPLTTTANSAWSQQQLMVCQVKNPFQQSLGDYPQINVEQVILAAPKIIIQPSSHANNAPAFVNWQQWPDIPAVENNAFIRPNADKLNRMTSRSLLELAKLCEQIDEFRDRYVKLSE